MIADKKSARRRVKSKEEEKKPVNRKAILALFVVTGLFSLFFWWRGDVIRQTPPNETVKVSKESSTSQPGSKTEDETTEVLKLMESRMVEELKEITATASGRYAVWVLRLKDGSGYGFGEDERMPGASLMKVPVMATVWREIAAGRLKLTDIYTMDEVDRATGSGPLQFKPAGSRYTVEELLMYLGKNSDNTAWVMFNRRLGSKSMQEMMTEMKMSESSYDDYIITARDTALMFEYIYKGRAGGMKSRDEIFTYLTDSIYEDRISVGVLGTGCEILAHKVGTDAGVWTDAGILKINGNPFVVVILNQEIKRVEAVDMVPDIVRRICTFEENPLKTR